jgi:hypothetical protein
MEQTVTRKLPSLLAALALAALSPAAFGHRLDEYLQSTLVVIEPAVIRLQVNLMPGTAVAGQVVDLVDPDHDGTVTSREGAAYVESVRRDLSVRLDGRELSLRPKSSGFPTEAELREGTGIIRMEFSVAVARLRPGPHVFVLENRHLAAASVYLINAAKPFVGTIEIVAQKRNEVQSSAEIDFVVR